MIVCTVLMIVCALLITNPIARAGNLHGNTDISLPPHFQPPAMPFLTGWGAWLPLNLHLAQNMTASLYLTTNVEITLLVALMFAVYVLALYFVARRGVPQQMKTTRTLLWIGIVVVGLIFVLLPGMASKDIFVYADYGDIFGRHGANPYFVLPIQVSPGDQLTQTDGWSNAFSAYGPLWSFVTALMAIALGDHPLSNFYAYRVLGLVCHIINIFLVGMIIRAAGRSERAATLGMLIYAWCPLTLFESILGGHNDAFMSVFLLLGIWLAFRAEHKGLTRPANYLPAIIALSLAGLVKFTTIPVVIFFLVLLAGKALGLPATSARSLQWKNAFKHVLIAGVIFVAITFIFYVPFWIGHSVKDILLSFGAPPSSSASQNSLMKVGVIYLKAHHDASGLTGHIMSILASHTLWTLFEVLGLCACFALSVWRTWTAPTMRTFVLSSLAALSILLLVTPWFYSWYVIWLIALAAPMLAFTPGRWGRALIIFSLIFSVSSLMTYFDMRLLANQLIYRCVLIYVPPVLAALVSFYLSSRRCQPQAVRTEPTTPEPLTTASIQDA
jgi:hypothetical protein